MVLIVWILASSYFIWTLSENTRYNDAIREKNQLESNVLSENVQITNTTYFVNGNDNVQISTAITNPSSLSVQFTTLWVYASNATPYTGYNFTQLSNVNVKGGANLTLNFNMIVGGLRSTGAYSFASWLITGRGNVVPLQKSTSSNIVTSQTTQGIGSLMMSFTNFFYYKVILNQGSYYLDFSSQASGYLVNKNDAPIAFMVTLTNLDSKDDILLNPYSEFFSILPFTGGAYQAVTWYIVNVNLTTGLINVPFTNILLPHPAPDPIPKSVYFASMDPVQSSFTPLPQNKMAGPGTAPVNLALIGTKGGSPFGQNIPFVSIYINS
jgi:hypothetical protein